MSTSSRFIVCEIHIVVVVSLASFCFFVIIYLFIPVVIQVWIESLNSQQLKEAINIFLQKIFYIIS